MRLFNLAISNIKLNIKKYSMYIFSMGFSVFTVYTFLALMENETVNMAFLYDQRYKALLTSFGVIIMVFVIFFLVSSNSSFIRARKKEISMYALFGMTNSKIGKLLFIETIIVGSVTLIIGIAFGIFFSKLMAMFLLNLTLESFTQEIGFSIGKMAIAKTTAVFYGVFCIMGLSGLYVVSKFELVDLFKASKVSEGRFRGSMVLLILSVLLIASGYFIACSQNLYVVVNGALPILILVISGTYLFFFGGLSKVMEFLKKNSNFFLRGENIISVTSISHRMKTTASVMATIAVLSAVAVTAIATGFTLYSNIESNVKNNQGFDVVYYGNETEIDSEIIKIIQDNGSKTLAFSEINLYRTEGIDSKITKDTEMIEPSENYFRVYKESEYNKICKISKADVETVNVSKGEAVYVYPYSFGNIEKSAIDKKIGFKTEKIQIKNTIKSNVGSFQAFHSLILNDKDFEHLMENREIVSEEELGSDYEKASVLNYENALKEKVIYEKIQPILEAKTNYYFCAYPLYVESMETFGLICFIGFFMSSVFILMTASLLYFKQIMAAEEERNQYRMLRRIGMDDRLEKKVIRNRLMPVFFIPLGMGIIHSIFAMKTADTLVFSNIIRAENSYISVLGFSGIMYALYAMVYVLFYFITKSQYSRIVRS